MHGPRTLRHLIITSVAGAILTLAGCGFVSMDAKGTWADAAGDVVLTFTQEGMISGTDGCNNVKGTWEEHGKDLNLTMTIAEDNVCPGFEGWLTDPLTGHIDGTTMTLYGPNESYLGELTER